MIELKEGWYYSAVWFIDAGHIGQDVMGMIWKEGPKDSDEPWKLSYRFRYYNDDKVFESKDEKSWHNASCKANTLEEELVSVTKKSFQHLADEMGGKFTWNTIRGDHMAAFVAITGEECTHVKQFKTKEEADEYINKHG